MNQSPRNCEAFFIPGSDTSSIAKATGKKSFGVTRIIPSVLRSDRVLLMLSNQKMNAYLKEIADCCGITKI